MNHTIANSDLPLKHFFRIFKQSLKQFAMKENDLVSVYVGSAINARYLEAALAQADISCLVRNELVEASHGGYGGPGTDDSCQIFVELQDYAAAEKLIFEFENSKNE